MGLPGRSQVAAGYVMYGSATLLVTDSSSVGQVIENESIANMPLNGRAFWQLAQLTPGAVYTGLAIDTAQDRLYAANTAAGRIDLIEDRPRDRASALASAECRT